MRVQHTFTAFISLASFEHHTAYAEANSTWAMAGWCLVSLRVDAVILVHMCGGKDGHGLQQKGRSYRCRQIHCHKPTG